MPSKSYRKGTGFELECVKAAKAFGIPSEDCHKNLMSGGGKGAHVGLGDITIKVMGLFRKLECKIEAHGFKRIYDWLLEGNNYAVVTRRDRGKALITMYYEDWLRLVHASAYGKAYSDMNMTKVPRCEDEVDAE